MHAAPSVCRVSSLFNHLFWRAHVSVSFNDFNPRQQICDGMLANLVRHNRDIVSLDVRKVEGLTDAGLAEIALVCFTDIHCQQYSTLCYFAEIA